MKANPINLKVALLAALASIGENIGLRCERHMQKNGLILNAVVTGPLMSLDASGGFAGTLVFGKWKGRNVVRQLVTPSNPQSADQEISRNRVRTVGVAQHWANVTTEKRSGETVTDKQELISLAPAGQAWNGFLAKSMIGAGGLNYDNAVTAWTGLTSPEKTDWDDAADSLTPAMLGVYQADEFGIAGTPLTSGEVFFIYQYGLYVAGARTTVPGAVPPVYA